MSVHEGPPPEHKKAQRILRPRVDRARAIVREESAAIETIAAELMTADRLTAEQIAELVKQSAPLFLPDGVLPERQDAAKS